MNHTVLFQLTLLLFKIFSVKNFQFQYNKLVSNGP